MSFPIALQLYSVRKELEKNYYGVLKQVKAMGYDGVEFAGLFDHTAAEVREMCRDIGLIPISAHVSYPEMVEDPEGVISQCAEIGCKYLAVPGLGREDRPGAPKFPEALKNIEMLANVAKKYGIHLMYHNHDFEFMRINGKYGLEVIFDSIPKDLLSPELDLCWVNVGGEDPADYLKKYAGRVHVVHYKDFYGERTEENKGALRKDYELPVRPENFEYRPTGFGLQNFPEILEATKAVGCEWVVVEQDYPSLGLNPLECAKKSVDYLKSIGV